MVENVEISSFDLRFEGHRLKNEVSEGRLLASISQTGIREPLQGVDSKECRILLNGFKRYRCAQRLNIKIAPYCSLGNDEATGIIKLIQISNSKSLSILEQAALIEELRSVHKMSVREIAEMLEKSKSWVSMRIGIINEMSECLRSNILSGKFPAYSYMYTLRQFIRMNSIEKQEIDRFVNTVAGKKLSIRQIEQLAYGYFKGSNEYREQIESGNISWVLKRCNEINPDKANCTKIELSMLNDLEIVQKYMNRVMHKCNDNRFKNNNFFVQANILVGGILRITDSFYKAIGGLYDKTTKA